MTELEAKKALLSCPGDTIQETIDSIGMSQAELAERLGRSIPKLNELIKGKAPITKETATKLEYVLGIPASGWLKLERKYQDELLEIERLEFYNQCIDWLNRFPLKLMKQYELIPETNEKTVLVESLLKFFRVASPNEWNGIYKNTNLAFKIDLRHTAEPEAVSVWLRFGEIQAESVNVEEFDKGEFREKIPEIKELSYTMPENWQEQLQTICAECGIALVYTPCISKAPIFGAARWIKNYSLPLLQITDRLKSINAFWFTFFHESAHLLYHGKKEIFIEGLENIEIDKTKEKEADDFSERTLIKESQMNEMTKHSNIPHYRILEFSEKFRIHPGIVVAQLQRKDKISYKDFMANKLKKKMELTINTFK